MPKQIGNGIFQDMILPSFRKHLTEQSHVRLFNTFLGVPISYEAEVALVNPVYIGLIVHPYQAVCIKYERRTYIKSSAITTLIRAHPISIDYTNYVVMLKRFRVPKSIANDLHNSWISPDKPVSVEIQSHKVSAHSGKLMQIAVLAENCVRVVLAVPEDAPCKRNDSLNLKFQLDKDQSPIQLEGDVFSLVKIRNQNKKRLDVVARAVMQDEITILAYIAQREDQIKRKLDKVYQNLRGVKKTTNR